MRRMSLIEAIEKNEAMSEMIKEYMSEAKELQEKVIELLIYDYLTMDSERMYLKTLCENNYIDYEVIRKYVSCIIQELRKAGVDLELREGKLKLVNIIEDRFLCLYDQLYIRAFKESAILLPRITTVI